MAILGKNIIILKGKTGNTPVIAAVKSTEINHSVNLIEISSPTQADYSVFITGRRGWGFSTAYLVTTSDTGLFTVGDLLEVRIVVDGRVVAKGEAFCKTCRVTASLPNLAQGSFEFVGNGSLQSEQ